MFIKLSVLIALIAAPLCAWAWADTGHILVGELARRNTIKSIVANVDGVTQSFVDYFPEELTRLPYSTTFMDYIKHDTVLFDALHFIDFPYTRPNDAPDVVPEPESTNLLFGLDKIYTTMRVKGNSTGLWGKGFSTLLLVHILGDMHQPLHAVSLFSRELNFLAPLGDMGGNLYKLSYTSEFGMTYTQSHLLFDCVAGLWCSYMPHPVTRDFEAFIASAADDLERDFPIASFSAEELFPDISTRAKWNDAMRSWALESFEMAKEAYADFPALGKTPTPEFIAKWRTLLRKRVAIAGYRLAYVLESLDYSEHGPSPNEFTPENGKVGNVAPEWRAFAIVLIVVALAAVAVAGVMIRNARAAVRDALASKDAAAAAAAGQAGEEEDERSAVAVNGKNSYQSI